MNEENKPNVKISFPNISKEQREHIFNAEKELRLAGVTFDTGMDLQSSTRDWEFDYSLKGAIIKIREEKEEEVETTEEATETAPEGIQEAKTAE